MSRNYTVEKSDCLSSYDSDEAVSRFYKLIGTKRNPYVFVVTVEKGAEVHFVFTFEDLGGISEVEGYEDFERFEKTETLRVYFEDGVTDLLSYTHRKAYKSDYNKAVHAMKIHVQEDEALTPLVVRDMI